MSPKAKGNIALLGVGFAFGASSPIAKLLSPFLSPFGVVGVRFLFALPFALAQMWYKGERVYVPRAQLLCLSCVAALQPVSSILFTMALFSTKISLAIFSFYVANLVTSLVVGLLVHKERISMAKGVAFALALVAVVLFTDPFNSFEISAGMLIGYLSGVLQTAASHYQKKYASTFNVPTLTFAQIIGGIVIGFGIAFAIGDFGIFTLPAYAVGLAALIGAMMFAINRLSVYGYARADIGTGTLLQSSELVFGPLFALLIFGEVLGMYEIVGALLVIVATILVARG